MRKKILAILFAALLTLAMAVPAFANEHGDFDGDQINVDPDSQQGQSLTADGDEDQG